MFKKTCGSLVGITYRRDDRPDLNLKLCGEFKIAFIVSRHGHDRPRAVTDQHIIGDPDGHFFVVDRVDRIATGENATFSLGEVRPVEIALHRGLLTIGLNRRPIFGSRQSLDSRMLGCEHHICHSEQCVRSRRINA